MRLTDFLLIVIAALMATGIGAFIWASRRRAYETEMMRTALYSITSSNLNTYFKTHNAIPITLDPGVNKAITRFARTAVDIQGMVELMSRYLVTQMPTSVIEDMEIPSDWVTQTKEE